MNEGKGRIGGVGVQGETAFPLLAALLGRWCSEHYINGWLVLMT